MTRRAAAALLLLTTAAMPAGADGPAATKASADPQLAQLASEARQTIEVIDWFYVRHRACPQASRPAEMRELEGGLGDGFTIEPEGRFVAIRGISMSAVWLYYAPPGHPDRCTLLRALDAGPALIWRRHRWGGNWAFDPGDGSGERPVRPAP